MKYILIFFSFLFLQFAAAADVTLVVFETTMGSFQVQLDSEKAPVTVKNFLEYVDSGFYTQTLVHRVVKGFVIQGGGLSSDMIEKPTRDPIINEAGNGLSNLQGTIAMARTSEVNSATAQFFVNTVDNLRLDHKDETPAHFGYAVFGKVIQGFEIIKAMEQAAVHTVGEYENTPDPQILILSIKRKN